MTLEQENAFLQARINELHAQRSAQRSEQEFLRRNATSLSLSRSESAEITEGKFFVPSKELQKNGKPKKIPVEFTKISIGNKSWKITARTAWATLSKITETAKRLCSHDSIANINATLLPFVENCAAAAAASREQTREQSAAAQFRRDYAELEALEEHNKKQERFLVP